MYYLNFKASNIIYIMCIKILYNQKSIKKKKIKRMPPNSKVRILWDILYMVININDNCFYWNIGLWEINTTKYYTDKIVDALFLKLLFTAAHNG